MPVFLITRRNKNFDYLFDGIVYWAFLSAGFTLTENVAGIVATYGLGGLSLATVMAGILLILMGVFKFGSLIKYIPYTITTGFTAGTFRVYAVAKGGGLELSASAQITVNA